MSEQTIKLYGNKAYGVTVSNYGIENGYLDYRTLADIVGDCILNNAIFYETEPEDWEIVCGEDYYGLDENGHECELYTDECIDMIPHEIYQHYIISENGFNFLNEYTDEIVYYNANFDLYLWGITHLGTSWDYVLTDVRLLGEDELNDCVKLNKGDM